MKSARALVCTIGLGVGSVVGACGGGGAGACQAGNYGCACIDDVCVVGLECIGGVCLVGDGQTSGDGDGDTTGDGDGDTTGDGDGDPTGNCDPGLDWCGGKCVDTDEHPLHCGACNNACAEGEVCLDGTCEFIEDCTETPCPGFSYCDPLDMLCKPGCADDDQCGSNEACDVGTHECVCAAGYQLCEGSCIPDDEPCGELCGNAVIDPGETCDTANLDGESCQSLGYTGGALACDPDCMSFDTSACVNTCEGDEFIAIDAVDADDIDGWIPVMSNFGEGLVLAWDDMTPDASVTWDLDIPCADTWHVWIRAIDGGDLDSYYALIDGDPNPPAIHEQDCTANPQNPEYTWRELNWRIEQDPPCVYEQDPWTQNWIQGAHSVAIGYREGYALSKIWVTNTNMSPP